MVCHESDTVILLYMVKKILLFILAIVLLWVAIALVRARIFSNRAGAIIRTTVPFERAGKKTQKILVLGDSLGYGTGTSAPEKSVAGLVGSNYPDATVINKSVNGKRTPELAHEVASLDEHYDLILIIIGGNDVLRPWLNLNDSGKNLNTIYTAASKHATKVIALTTGNLRYTSFFLWPLNYYFGARSTELRDHAAQAAAKLPNVTYIDLVTRNKTVPFDHLKEAPDHLHLSDDGANYWYQAIRDSKAL